MQDRGLKLGGFTYTTLITYHGICGDGEKVREAYRELVDSGEVVDTVVLNVGMAAVFGAREHGSAKGVVEYYMKTFGVSLAPDIITFNTLILLQCQMENYERTMELVEEMEECKVDYDETISVALIKGFFWHGETSYFDWSVSRLEEPSTAGIR